MHWGKFLHSWNKKIWKFLFLLCKFGKQIVKKLEIFASLLKPQNCPPKKREKKNPDQNFRKPTKWNITSSSLNNNNTFIYQVCRTFKPVNCHCSLLTTQAYTTRTSMLDRYTNEKLVSITKSISTGAHYVTPDSTIYGQKKSKCTSLAQEICFSSSNSCSLPWLVKAQHNCAPPKKSVINWTWLRLSISHWSIKMIGPGGLLLVVPTYMQFQLHFYRWGCPKKQLNWDI